MSDTGNLFSVSGFPPQVITDPFTGLQSEGYFQGRFADGPVWLEHFIASLELDPSSSLPSFLGGGTNYSWGGAETGCGISARETPNIGNLSCPNPLPGTLPTQIQFFFLDLIGGVTEPLDDNTLIAVWAGPNDIVNNPDNQNPYENPEIALVNNISAHIQGLITLGGTNFLVPNMPALGQLPRYVNTDAEEQFDLLSTQFNEALSAALDDLEELNNGVTIIRFNVFDLVLQMVNNPSVFGFENVTGTAKSIVGEEPSTFFLGTVVDDPENYMFFDDVHPTTRSHEIVADFAFNTTVISSVVVALENNEVVISGRNSEKTRDALIKKLTDAEMKIDQGKFSEAIEKLVSFNDKSTDLASAGKLDKDVSRSMVEAANAVIASLTAYVL